MATLVRVFNDTVCIAVGKDLKESLYIIAWALHNSGGRRFCILHVHTPARKIPMLLGAKFGIALADEYEVRAHHEKERQKIDKILDKYLFICGQAGAQVEKLYFEADNIAKGIVDLISQFGIRNVVMGAAASKCYSRKATCDREQAPSCGDMAGDSPSVSLTRTEGRDSEFGSFALCDDRHTSPPSTVGNAPETVYAAEVLARSEEDIEQMKRQINMMVQELGQKMLSTTELLLKYKKERDDLEVERDNALKEASSSSAAQFYAEFSFSEIKEATSNFDPNLKIGNGGRRSVYRGVLRQMPVAIKILNPDSSQGPSELQQEVNVLSKVRHPNLVTLIGACSENFTLIYEYLPNGNLDDCINCKGNTPPLTWQTRIRIATELRSALIFLHSRNGQGIVYGDIKPANILLDSNFVSKLSDFGICRALLQEELSDDKFTRHCITDPKSTIVYMDPMFIATRELTPQSDVYSSGIILLRLLTGKPAFRIADEVQCALDQGNLRDLLDPTAGDWPFVQAKQLASLALRCCEMNHMQRPELASEDWKVLEQLNQMRASSDI